MYRRIRQLFRPSGLVRGDVEEFLSHCRENSGFITVEPPCKDRLCTQLATGAILFSVFKGCDDIHEYIHILEDPTDRYSVLIESRGIDDKQVVHTTKKGSNEVLVWHNGFWHKRGLWEREIARFMDAREREIREAQTKEDRKLRDAWGTEILRRLRVGPYPFCMIGYQPISEWRVWPWNWRKAI